MKKKQFQACVMIQRGLALLLALTFFATGTMTALADNPDLPPDKGGEGGAPASSAPTYSGGDSSQNDGAGEYIPPPEPPKVENNAGEMGTNIGEVKNNKGTVKNNQGTILENSGDVTQNTGTIEDNDGTVAGNFGEVTQNTGTIRENFGTIANNTGTVEHHYFNMNTAMSPGDYIISYGDGFRMEQDADGVPRIYLRAGARPVNENGEQQDAIIRITVPGNREVETVILRINGQDVALIPLGNGRYRIPELPMPEGPDGFAMNEGAVIVLTKEKEGGVSEEEVQEIETLWTNFVNAYDSAPPSFNELANRDKNGVIRIEGISLSGKNRTQILGELSERTDVQMALARAYALKGSDPDEMVTFVTEDGVRVTTTLRELKTLMTPLLPVRESIIYKEENPEGERTDEEIIEELLEDIKNTPDDGYIMNYTYESGHEIVIIFMNAEEKKKFEDAVKVYLDEYGEPTESEPIRNMTEFEENCRRLGLDLNYYLENPDRVTDGTFAKDLKNRVLLREAGLPNDLLNAVPLDNRAAVLAGLAMGTFEQPEQRQRLIRELGEEAAQELLQRWQEEVQNLQQKIRNEMRKHKLPLEMLNTEKMAAMSYAELQAELDRIKNATSEERREWKQAYEQELRTIEQSNNRLNYLHLPEDMLDAVPPVARHSILEKIENGTLDAPENRWLLNTWLGEEGAEKLIRDVKRIRGAYARNKLVEYGLPANWMNLYPSDQRAEIEAGLATATDADLRKFADDYHKWTRESQDMLRQMNLPADLLKQIPVGSHRVILDQIKAGYLENENMRSALEDLYGKEVINQLVKDVKQAQKAQAEAKKENAKKKLVEYGMPADWMDALSPEERAKAEAGLATATDAELKTMATEYVKLYRASQDRLKQMDLPADLLKKIPVGAHIPLLDQIKAGYLENENMRSALEQMFGKEVIDQLVKDVKQAKTERVVRTELEKHKLPTDLLNTVPVDSQEEVLKALKTGSLEPQRESLEKALGKNGYKTFENNFYAAMAAAQPKDLPQDLLRKNVPRKQHGDYMAKYKAGTVQERQWILTMIGYY